MDHTWTILVVHHCIQLIHILGQYIVTQPAAGQIATTVAKILMKMCFDFTFVENTLRSLFIAIAITVKLPKIYVSQASYALQHNRSLVWRLGWLTSLLWSTVNWLALLPNIVYKYLFGNRAQAAMSKLYLSQSLLMLYNVM